MKQAAARLAEIESIPSLLKVVPASSPKNRTIALGLIMLSVGLSNSEAQVTRSVLRPSQVQRVVTPVTQPVRVEEDLSVDLSGLGGMVYSTGLEEVWVRLISQKHHSLDGAVPVLSQLSLAATNLNVHLGSNHEDKFLKLGKLPVGEIRIRAHAPNKAGRYTVETGPASRNPDNLRHATVRQITNGVVEVRFENSLGLGEASFMSGPYSARLLAHNHFFHDCILQFGGGVTLDSTVFTLLTMSKDTDPEKSKVAKAALKQIHPNIARSAGIP